MNRWSMLALVGCVGCAESETIIRTHAGAVSASSSSSSSTGEGGAGGASSSSSSSSSSTGEGGAGGAGGASDCLGATDAGVGAPCGCNGDCLPAKSCEIPLCTNEHCEFKGCI